MPIRTLRAHLPELLVDVVEKVLLGLDVVEGLRREDQLAALVGHHLECLEQELGLGAHVGVEDNDELAGRHELPVNHGGGGGGVRGSAARGGNGGREGAVLGKDVVTERVVEVLGFPVDLARAALAPRDVPHVGRAQALDVVALLGAVPVVQQVHRALREGREPGVECGEQRRGDHLEGLLVAGDEHVHGEAAGEEGGGEGGDEHVHAPRTYNAYSLCNFWKISNVISFE